MSFVILCNFNIYNTKKLVYNRSIKKIYEVIFYGNDHDAENSCACSRKRQC